MNRRKETNFMQVNLSDDDSSSSYGSSDEDEFEYDGFDNSESQGDVKFQNIKTTSRKIGDPAMWDLFEDNPPEVDSGSAAAMVWTHRFEKLMLIMAYVLTFIIVLGGALINKGLSLFMIAQISIRQNRTLPFCNKDRLIADDTKEYELRRQRFDNETLNPNELALAEELEMEQVAWIWCLIFAFGLPELFTFLRCARKVFLRKDYSHDALVGTKDAKDKTLNRRHSLWPTFFEFLFVFFMETVHVVGLVVLTFIALPQMDSAHAIVLTNCVGFGPSLFRVLNFGNSPNDNSSTRPKTTKTLVFTLDLVALIMQLSGALAWPILQWTNHSTADDQLMSAWALPVGLLMTSFGWWETFVPENEEKTNGERPTNCLRLLPSPLSWMQDLRKTMIDHTRYSTYLMLSIWKMGLFFGSACGVSIYYGLVREPKNLFNKFSASFLSHNYTVSEVVNVVEDIYRHDSTNSNNEDVYEDWEHVILQTVKNSPLEVLIIQMACGYLTYILGKFACKVKIQEFSFSAPLCAIVPIAATLILSFCGARARDECAFNPAIPEYLFFECPDVGDFWQYLWNEQIWLWCLWYLSQVWITRHIWQPMSDKLASTEQMFGTPYYCGLLVDQSILFNRRRDGSQSAKFREMQKEMREKKKAEKFTKYVPGANSGTDALEVMNQKFGGNATDVMLNDKKVTERDKVTRIYGCSTMWHENEEEMMEYLKSVFRVDIDYSKRRLAQKYFGVNDPDYYEWETHIFFDDAFKKGPPDAPDEKPVNIYVNYLINSIDEAATYAHGRKVKVKPPRKIPTPYGGRLIWTLPGKTKIVAHLKDKSKIRNKKRWSQCMYMYYLLGFKLVDNPKLNDAQKEMRAQNTYLLALDGDIDFQPEAITRLVDKMKKNQNLGAACGRILPTGSGFMVWYQKFEYAIGHWLQKATEHVMGCVLCSPGCFSLFRGRALMDANVMKKYTTNPTQPIHHVQYDQGEDRWLCTLILVQGWRIEYSAASDSYTAAPTAFNEFFNQRRRWMPSTIANIFDLLMDYKRVCANNPDISYGYICYQGMIMVGTVLGPGTIFLMLVGALQAAFKMAFWNAFLFQLFPILGFMAACQFTKKDVQLIIAQLLSVFYVLVMMAVLVGILLQMADDGATSPSAIGIWLVGGSFILSAILHPQEFGCLPYGVIYYVTIPSMYLLLVIFSIYNLNDVSWGTREVAADALPVKNEEAEKKAAEEAAKKAKEAKKSEGGIIGYLMETVGATGNADKGGLDFSLANLCRCMCFTHEDTAASDSKTQLVKIAASLEGVNERLAKIENGMPGGGSDSWGARRKSSYRRSLRSNRLGSYGGPSLSPVPSEDVGGENNENIGNPQGLHTGFNPSASLQEQMIMEHEESDSEDDGEHDEPFKEPRDDLRNPFWIEDKNPKIRNGPRGHLKMDEIEFWKELIPKYLESFEKKYATKKEEEEDLREKENVKRGLGELRDQMVFSVFMLNAIFVVIISLVQQEKETLSINWFFPKNTNGTFVEYVYSKSTPTVRVDREYVTMDPIGFVFLFFFAIVIVIQVIGMLFHRWETISHIISDTKLPWFAKTEEIKGEFEFDEEKSASGRRRSSVHPNDMLAVTGELMKEGAIVKDRRGSGHSTSSMDSETRKNTAMNSGFAGRRKTLKAMKKDFNKNKGEGEFVDLEKNFKKQLENLDDMDLEKSKNPALRRLSTRRGTMTAVMDRRKSLGLAKSSNRPRTTFKEEDEHQDDIYGARSRDGFSNLGFVKELDEVGDEEIDSVLEGSNVGSAYSRNSQQFENL